jgi:catechol 2,3-dioxygenase-like lactoylglutathione lyase family enzyme
VPVVPSRINLVTLGVADVRRATAFYDALGWRRSSASVEDVVSFFDLDSCVLAVWSAAALAAEAQLATPGSPGAVGLAINVPAAADVDAVIAAAVEAGGSVLRPAGDALEFEGRSGYFADPDGHPWEVAHNPGFELDATGRLRLP